ncbi:MAG: hypothetical protein MJE66_17855 [Proteobacteria bacterium]|nr:hypothetical protein [Pseudomonadota bacterium]
MFGAALLSLAAVAALLAVACALYDRWAASRETSRLTSTRVELPVEELSDRLESARTRFSVAVERHEQALQSGGARVLATTSYPEGIPIAKTVEELDAEREAARQELLEAQRSADALSLGHGPDSRVHAFAGSGVMRAWQLGPVGFERFWIRLDHAVDPDCWVLYEAKRMRWGLGLGAERQRLALQSLRASAEQLPVLLRAGLDGRELAFRPGIVPSRVWYRLRRPSLHRTLNRALLGRARLDSMGGPPDREVRGVVLAAFADEAGAPLPSLDVLPKGPGLLRIAASGPALMFGAWSGRRPGLRVVAASAHDVWAS